MSMPITNQAKVEKKYRPKVDSMQLKKISDVEIEKNGITIFALTEVKVDEHKLCVLLSDYFKCHVSVAHYTGVNTATYMTVKGLWYDIKEKVKKWFNS